MRAGRRVAVGNSEEDGSVISFMFLQHRGNKGTKL